MNERLNVPDVDTITIRRLFTAEFWTRVYETIYMVPIMLTYLRHLPTAKQNPLVLSHLVPSDGGLPFRPAPRLWLTSLGISVVIGIGLILSVSGNGKPDFWTTTRLFLMPFCVSSFAALVKDRAFVLIFSPVWREDLIALGGLRGVCAVVFLGAAYRGAMNRAPTTLVEMFSACLDRSAKRCWGPI